MQELSHVNKLGEISMVDVGNKEPSLRIAKACGYITVSALAMQKIQDNSLKKGDILTVAKIAGINGAKKTSEIIPLCHSLLLDKVDINIELDTANNKVVIVSMVKTFGKTGVEMEALCAVSCALLGIYDMLKAVDKNAVLSEIKLLEKSGGKSGHYIRGEHED
ncbi:MAG: cyclic pyranopterin monophosphate synthase MoaC [Alphaproteobacteria bacterium]|jgi:cyclic pyranopterin phosphate synthase|nr:cyclic pyranopterin monophosphate synthase MoaC [Alphaproteobacteria bacterium]